MPDAALTPKTDAAVRTARALRSRRRPGQRTRTATVADATTPRSTATDATTARGASDSAMPQQSRYIPVRWRNHTGYIAGTNASQMNGSSTARGTESADGTRTPSANPKLA